MIAEGIYPDIEAINESYLCIYINNNNLYLIKSSDGGETWSQPLQINDVEGTVVAEENSIEIHKGGIAWVDNRLIDLNICWNKLPGGQEPPFTPYAPNPENNSTMVDIDAILSWSGGDPDIGDTVTYDVYFGISNPPPKIISNQTEDSYAPYDSLDYDTEYYWKIIAWDDHDSSASGPVWNFSTKELNHPPYPPEIDGPNYGMIGVEYTFSFVSIDQNNDSVYYFVNWGDGNDSGWIGPYCSGDDVILNHTWSRLGFYRIKVKAKDIFDYESDWSTLRVIMPRNAPILNLFASQFPNVYSFLNQVFSRVIKELLLILIS